MVKQKTFRDKMTSKSDILLCICGGIIKMKTISKRGKFHHYAQCEECHKTARKPKILMER